MTKDCDAQAKTLEARLKRLQEVLLDWQPRTRWVSSRTLVATFGPAQLWSFEAATSLAKPAQAPPLLIVSSMINRAYMLDLGPDQSFVKRLQAEGLKVFLLDWQEPSADDASKGLDSYVDDCLAKAVETLRDTYGQLCLLGVCQGGVLGLSLAASRPNLVDGLVLVGTPGDCSGADDLVAQWASALMPSLDSLAAKNIPGQMLNWVFNSLRPASQHFSRYNRFLDKDATVADVDAFLRLERWRQDSPAQPGRAFREFVQQVYVENRLAKGQLPDSGGAQKAMSTISAKVLNVVGSSDHIVPPASSLALRKWLPAAHLQELVFQGGHIGVYVSPRAQSIVGPGIAAWAKEALGP